MKPKKQRAPWPACAAIVTAIWLTTSPCMGQLGQANTPQHVRGKTAPATMPASRRAMDTTRRTVPAKDHEQAMRARQSPFTQYPIRLRLRGGAGIGQRARSSNAVTATGFGGFQLVLPPNESQGYGVELDYLQTDTRRDRRYLSLGLFVEQRLFGWFISGIGFKGVIPMHSQRPIPFGITTRLGFKPQWHKYINPIVTFRSDWIFGNRIQGVTSIEAGVEFSLYAFVN